MKLCTSYNSLRTPSLLALSPGQKVSLECLCTTPNHLTDDSNVSNFKTVTLCEI